MNAGLRTPRVLSPFTITQLRYKSKAPKIAYLNRLEVYRKVIVKKSNSFDLPKVLNKFMRGAKTPYNTLYFSAIPSDLISDRSMKSKMPALPLFNIVYTPSLIDLLVLDSTLNVPFTNKNLNFLNSYGYSDHVSLTHQITSLIKSCEVHLFGNKAKALPVYSKLIDYKKLGDKKFFFKNKPFVSALKRFLLNRGLNKPIIKREMNPINDHNIMGVYLRLIDMRQTILTLGIRLKGSPSLLSVLGKAGSLDFRLDGRSHRIKEVNTTLSKYVHFIRKNITGDRIKERWNIMSHNVHFPLMVYLKSFGDLERTAREADLWNEYMTVRTNIELRSDGAKTLAFGTYIKLTRVLRKSIARHKRRISRRRFSVVGRIKRLLRSSGRFKALPKRYKKYIKRHKIVKRKVYLQLPNRLGDYYGFLERRFINRIFKLDITKTRYKAPFVNLYTKYLFLNRLDAQLFNMKLSDTIYHSRQLVHRDFININDRPAFRNEVLNLGDVIQLKQDWIYNYVSDYRLFKDFRKVDLFTTISSSPMPYTNTMDIYSANKNLSLAVLKLSRLLGTRYSKVLTRVSFTYYSKLTKAIIFDIKQALKQQLVGLNYSARAMFKLFRFGQTTDQSLSDLYNKFFFSLESIFRLKSNFHVCLRNALTTLSVILNLKNTSGRFFTAGHKILGRAYYRRHAKRTFFNLRKRPVFAASYYQDAETPKYWFTTNEFTIQEKWLYVLCAHTPALKKKRVKQYIVRGIVPKYIATERYYEFENELKYIDLLSKLYLSNKSLRTASVVDQMFINLVGHIGYRFSKICDFLYRSKGVDRGGSLPNHAVTESNRFGPFLKKKVKFNLLTYKPPYFATKRLFPKAVNRGFLLDQGMSVEPIHKKIINDSSLPNFPIFIDQEPESTLSLEQSEFLVGNAVAQEKRSSKPINIIQKIQNKLMGLLSLSPEKAGHAHEHTIINQDVTIKAHLRSERVNANKVDGYRTAKDIAKLRGGRFKELRHHPKDARATISRGRSVFLDRVLNARNSLRNTILHSRKFTFRSDLTYRLGCVYLGQLSSPMRDSLIAGSGLNSLMTESTKLRFKKAIESYGDERAIKILKKQGSLKLKKGKVRRLFIPVPITPPVSGFRALDRAVAWHGKITKALVHFLWYTTILGRFLKATSTYLMNKVLIHENIRKKRLRNAIDYREDYFIIDSLRGEIVRNSTLSKLMKKTIMVSVRTHKKRSLKERIRRSKNKLFATNLRNKKMRMVGKKSLLPGNHKTSTRAASLLTAIAHLKSDERAETILERIKFENIYLETIHDDPAELYKPIVKNIIFNNKSGSIIHLHAIKIDPDYEKLFGELSHNHKYNPLEGSDQKFATIYNLLETEMQNIVEFHQRIDKLVYKFNNLQFDPQLQLYAGTILRSKLKCCKGSRLPLILEHIPKFKGKIPNTIFLETLHPQYYHYNIKQPSLLNWQFAKYKMQLFIDPIYEKLLFNYLCKLVHYAILFDHDFNWFPPGTYIGAGSYFSLVD